MCIKYKANNNILNLSILIGRHKIKTINIYNVEKLTFRGNSEINYLDRFQCIINLIFVDFFVLKSTQPCEDICKI